MRNDLTSSLRGSAFLAFLVLALAWPATIGAQTSGTQSVQVQLGQHGGTATLVEGEDGGYTWNGMAVSHGTTITAPNGNQYVLTLSNGRWSATFLPRLVRVALGTSGAAITLRQLEDGRYWWGGPVESGLTITDANGVVYRLVLANGQWSADIVQDAVIVSLGQSGETIELVRLSDGAFSYNGNRVQDGSEVTDSRGNVYVLRLRNGTWSAVLPPSPPPGGGPPTSPPVRSDVLQTYIGVEPTLTTGEDGTRRSVLKVGGFEYSVYELFANESFTASETMAERAASAVTLLLKELGILATIFDDDKTGLTDIVQERWIRLRDAFAELFGSTAAATVIGDLPVDRNNAVDLDELTEKLQDMETALASYAEFHSAVVDGVFTGAIDSDETEAAFDAVRSVTKMRFGSTANTRFGAYLRYAREGYQGWEDDLRRLSGDSGIGAFAYSPLAPATRASLPARGEADFLGRVVAVTAGDDMTAYVGTIEITIRFSSNRVGAVIRDLRDEDGAIWRYAYGDVETILMPNSSLQSDGSFSVNSGNATVSYPTTVGGPRPRVLRSDFEGQVLGTGTEAGEAIIGTWNLAEGSSGNTLLTGAFGAEYESSATTVLPIYADGGLDSRTYLGAQPDSSGDIQLAGEDEFGGNIEFSVADLYARGTAEHLGPSLMSVAKAEVERQLRLLDVWIEIGGADLERNRIEIWTAANKTLHETVFGSDYRARNPLGLSYPTGSDRDSRARRILVEAAEALGSLTAFEDALDGGIFDEESDAVTDAESMFAVLHREVRVEYRNTDFGRFGVWSRIVGQSARVGAEPDPTNPSGSFAYSPAEQTVYLSGDPGYPQNGTADYAGLALVVEADATPRVFEGTSGLTVAWGEGVSYARLSASFRGLRDVDTGDLLQYNGTAVDEITFTGVRLTSSLNGLIGFDTSSPVVRIHYSNFSRTSTRWSGIRSIRGKFVGSSIDGPIGAIGTWSIGGPRYSLSLDGAFAADLVP